MADVIALRPPAPATDGYGHRDVVIDADGVWWQRGPIPGQWLGFGERYETPADKIPQPWTLVAKAREVTSLAGTLLALGEQNDMLCRTLVATLGYLHRLRSGDIPDGDSAGSILDDAAGDIEHTLNEADPLRGGA